MILTFVQKTAAPGSRTIGLISAFRMVFPNFSVRILIKLDMLSANQKNHVVDEVAFYKKLLAFRNGKDWEDSVHKGGTLDSRCWQFSSTLFVFVVFSLPVDLALDVEFGKT